MADSEGEPEICPLCAEELDLTDKNFHPCPCGYQICAWCWHQLMEVATKDNISGRCPACRAEYHEENIDFKAPDPNELGKKLKKGKAPRPKAPNGTTSRKHLVNVRVIQRNLVYVVGLSLGYCKDELLRRPDFFGKYGKIVKVSVNRNGVYNNGTATGSAYVTYVRNDDALRCIKNVDGSMLDGKVLRACFGTTKYCNAFLKFQPCNNPECLYLHDLGEDDDSFTKEEMVSRSGSKHQLFHEATHPGALGGLGELAYAADGSIIQGTNQGSPEPYARPEQSQASQPQASSSNFHLQQDVSDMYGGSMAHGGGGGDFTAARNLGRVWGKQPPGPSPRISSSVSSPQLGDQTQMAAYAQTLQHQQPASPPQAHHLPSQSFTQGSQNATDFTAYRQFNISPGYSASSAASGSQQGQNSWAGRYDQTSTAGAAGGNFMMQFPGIDAGLSPYPGFGTPLGGLPSDGIASIRGEYGGFGSGFGSLPRGDESSPTKSMQPTFDAGHTSPGGLSPNSFLSRAQSSPLPQSKSSLPDSNGNMGLHMYGGGPSAAAAVVQGAAGLGSSAENSTRAGQSRFSFARSSSEIEAQAQSDTGPSNSSPGDDGFFQSLFPNAAVSFRRYFDPDMEKQGQPMGTAEQQPQPQAPVDASAADQMLEMLMGRVKIGGAADSQSLGGAHAGGILPPKSAEGADANLLGMGNAFALAQMQQEAGTKGASSSTASTPRAPPPGFAGPSLGSGADESSRGGKGGDGPQVGGQAGFSTAQSGRGKGNAGANGSKQEASRSNKAGKDSQQEQRKAPASSLTSSPSNGSTSDVVSDKTSAAQVGKPWRRAM